MTYLQFHLVFTLPLLAVLAAAQGRTRGPWWPLALIATIAFVYTTPWDNHLVANAVWTYPPGRVLATIGHVPVEEYAFFVIQTAIAGLWMRLVRERVPAAPPSPRGGTIRAVGGTVALAITLLGVGLWVQGGHGLYLGLILAWVGPILLLMWGLGGSELWARRRLLAWSILPPTLYLWVADWYAITQAGIWHITDATRTGWEIAGLPVEEALFFLVTNVMVVQGLVLLQPVPFAQIMGRLGVLRPRPAAA
ncbi:MAG: lycopene cyclase domain-containing protein [Bacteroidota bacterium]